MNRYKSGGPSKATSSTTCQKCLKKGHYSYECTASQQDRPYTSRPSRTQQLLNPKLAPKIVTAPLKGADPKAAERKRSFEDTHDGSPPAKRTRSVSSDSDSDSVSTISTRSSRPASPPQRHARRNGKDSMARSTVNERENAGSPSRVSRPGSRSPVRRSRRSRSPASGSSRSRSYSRERRGSLPARHRSRSPFRRHNRHHTPGHSRPRGQPARTVPSAARERSLSPYSRRLAMTRGGRNSE